MTTDAGPVARYRDQVHGSYVKPMDRLGRPQLRVLGPLAYLSAIPGLASKWLKVPPDYWNLTSGEDGVSFAEVACPCGETPQVEIGLLETCTCERVFWFAHDEVLVANSPKKNEDTAATGGADPPTPAAS